jgi:TfoX/Sxy family transcriptional regulator of competence genes
MPYDEFLVERLRDLLADESRVTEKRMFGGLAFMVHGNLCVAASHTGGLLTRVDPDDSDAYLAQPHVSLMEMRGRPMHGWLMVAPEALKTKRQLAAWLKRSVAFVKTLPPK